MSAFERLMVIQYFTAHPLHYFDNSITECDHLKPVAFLKTEFSIGKIVINEMLLNSKICEVSLITSIFFIYLL